MVLNVLEDLLAERKVEVIVIVRNAAFSVDDAESARCGIRPKFLDVDTVCIEAMPQILSG